MILNKYMDAYVDKRMADLIGEWQIARRDAVGDLDRRLGSLESEILKIRASEKTVSDRISSLEARAGAIKGRRS